MQKPRLVSVGSGVFIRSKTNGSSESCSVNHDNFSNRTGLCAGDVSFKFLPYQLSMVR